MALKKKLPPRPKDATHVHKGNHCFVPHYIKVEGDIVYTWFVSMLIGPHWNSMPAHDHLHHYELLGE